VLKKQNRLTNKHAFSATYKNNHKINSSAIVLYAGKSNQDKNCPVRVGFVVSKKVHKRAVKRNRIKRIMRETLRLYIKNSKYPVINNYISLIFSAKYNSSGANAEDIQKNISMLLDKLANKNF